MCVRVDVICHVYMYVKQFVFIVLCVRIFSPSIPAHCNGNDRTYVRSSPGGISIEVHQH